MKLIPHPQSPASPARSIEVVLARLSNGRLSLVFNVSGDIDRICLPSRWAPERRDGLWRRSCFEAFVRGPGVSPYVELNLSPTGEWAAYCFDSYRSGMKEAPIPAPVAQRMVAGPNLGIVASFDLGALIELPSDQPWQLNTCAVIEAMDGSLSHWALVHPRDTPDFHHPDCFVAELPPAGDL